LFADGSSKADTRILSDIFVATPDDAVMYEAFLRNDT
jgi:hypothetical protein